MKKLSATKKVFAIVGALIVLISAVGCGGGKGGNTNKNNPTSAVLPKLNITGEKVKFLTWDDAAALSKPDSYWYKVNEIMKKEYGCELEFVYANYADIATKLVTSVLSNQAPDLVKVRGEDFPNHIHKDIIDSPDDMIDWDSALWKDVKEINKSGMYKGKHYLITFEKYCGGVVFYNKEMFDANGLETPWELYKKKQWTWSKMEELAQVLTQDTDRDGIIDIYGFQAHPIRMIPTCGQDFVTLDENGKYVSNIRNANLRKLMDFVYNTGMVGTDCRELSLNGENAFKNDRLAMFWDEYWRIGSFADDYKSGKVEFAPSPKMDGADKYYVQFGGDCAFIAKNAPNKGGAVAYLCAQRFLRTDPECVAKSRKEQMENYGFGEEEMARIDELENGDFEFVTSRSAGVGEWGNVAVWELYNEIGVYENPWNTVLEKYEPILKAEIQTANAMSEE